MTELLWRLVAFVVSRRLVARWIIRRAQRTPYFHLAGYMDRWWLFNGYPEGQHDAKRWRRLPAIRVHHILREDRAAHLHDHPWDARTIILQGDYVERRRVPFLGQHAERFFWRKPGDTAAIGFGEFHHIERVSPGGVWTLFITWRYCGTWGFLVNRRKVPHREYAELFPSRLDDAA